MRRQLLPTITSLASLVAVAALAYSLGAVSRVGAGDA
jgi:hypothetical protein